MKRADPSDKEPVVITLDADPTKAQTAEDIERLFPSAFEVLKGASSEWKPHDIECVLKLEKRCGDILQKVTVKHDQHFDRLDFLFDGKTLSTSRFYCKHCNNIYHGAGGQKARHMSKAHPSLLKDPQQPQNKSITNSMTKPLSTQETKKVSMAVGKFGLDESVPFNKLSSDGFHELVRWLINFGARRGHGIGKKDALPGRKSVAGSSLEIADIRREILKDILQMAIKDRCFSIAFDFGKRIDDWLAAIVHFPTSEGTLMVFPLIFLDWNPDSPKAAEEVTEALTEELAQYEIDGSELHHMAAVTDQGANVKKAAKSCGFAVICMAHVLHTTCERVFQPFKGTKLSKPVQTDMKEVFDLIVTAESFAKYIQRAQFRRKLKRLPRRPVVTRWLSNSFLMKDMTEIFPKLDELFQENREIFGDHLADYRYLLQNKDLIAVLLSFFAVFEEAILSVEAEKHPTIQNVLGIFHGLSLLSDRLIAETDPLGDNQGPEFTGMRKSLGHSLKEVVEKKMKEALTDLHKLAAMLKPNYSSISNFPVSFRSKAELLLDKLAADYCEPESDPQPPPPKKSKSLFDFADTGNSTDLPSLTAIENELQAYRTLKEDVPDSELLKWWLHHRSTLPVLSRVAFKVLSIPASSASAERIFSKLKLVLTDHRRSMNPSTTSKLVQFSKVDFDLFD